jgi:hypothetical protein
MKTKTKNAWRRFVRAAKKAGAVRWQRSYHGVGRESGQGFDARASGERTT